MTTQTRMIVALDVDSAAEARALVARLGGHIGFYKVGMELYAAAGMDFVRELMGAGQRRFPRPEILRHRRDREARRGAWRRAAACVS